ncbi:MAG: 7-cyano-7-deazaguanine synthase QueC [Muribaculaceae bacterium]|nr:7-cyano-7-deazaguanine synthase QueC [Muribaculaceae bacterium]
MKDSILVLSGGMDSTTLLHDRKDQIALAVTFDYGSKHNAREIECARKNCEMLGIEHIVIPLEFMGKYFKSSLLIGGEEIPEGHYADENMKSTVVPFRNGIMLAIAAGLAESRGLKKVMLANHGGDHAIYPDCRPGFVDAMSEAIKEGTYDGIVIDAPYTNITKSDIARIGKRIGVDYTLTYSCYKGGEKHCGKCGTCVERMEALRDAGIEIKY